MSAPPLDPLRLQHLELFHCPVSEDYEHAKERAYQLLQQVLPEKLWRDFENRGVVQLSGRRGIYLISPYSQTEIRDALTGRCTAYSCLQLSIPAPTYDRMVAEYLLLRNNEALYWKTANVFSRTGPEMGLAALLLTAVDLALAANLSLEMLALLVP